MSLLGKKVEISVAKIDAKGEQSADKEVYVGTIIDKFLNVFPNSQGIPMQCDNFIIEKEDGAVESVHPSFITKIIK